MVELNLKGSAINCATPSSYIPPKLLLDQSTINSHRMFSHLNSIFCVFTTWYIGHKSFVEEVHKVVEQLERLQPLHLLPYLVLPLGGRGRLGRAGFEPPDRQALGGGAAPRSRQGDSLHSELLYG